MPFAGLQYAHQKGRLIMDIKKVVNIICLIAGICVLLFAALIGTRIIDWIPATKAIVLLVLGGVIVLWSLISMRK